MTYGDIYEKVVNEGKEYYEYTRRTEGEEVMQSEISADLCIELDAIHKQ